MDRTFVFPLGTSTVELNAVRSNLAEWAAHWRELKSHHLRHRASDPRACGILDLSYRIYRIFCLRGWRGSDILAFRREAENCGFNFAEALLVYYSHEQSEC